MIATLTIIVAVVLGLVVGGLSRRRQYQQDIATAKQKAQALQDAAAIDANQRAKAYLMRAKESVNTDRLATEDELTNQMADIEARRDRMAQRHETLNQQERRLNQRQAHIDDTQVELDDSKQLLEKARTVADALTDQRQIEVAKQAELDLITAQQMIRNQTARELSQEAESTVRELSDNAEASADKTARSLIIEAIQRGPVDWPREHFEHTVLVPTSEAKSRLIGKEGQHIRLLESLTGTDLIFDPDQTNVLQISTHDPIRRETTRIAIESLLASRRITATTIEKEVLSAENEVLKDLRQTGERVVSALKIGFMHPELIKIVGRLKFRTSYGQNVLSHSVEVAQMAGVMAAELGEDVRLAKRAGLLHDIGKAVDHEIEGTHVELGVGIAETYDENPVIINAIASHHGDVDITSPISVLVAAADSVSGARPGARSESVEEYINRLKNLEAIANAHKGVQESYAIQAGREIRIVVKPQELDDQASVTLTNNVKDQIEKDLTYPGKIKVTTIRELRAVEYVGDRPTKKKKKRKRA